MTTLGTSAILRQDFTDDFGARGEPVAVTAPIPQLQNPMWTDDGREILYVAGLEGARQLWRVSSSGDGKPQPLSSVDRIGIHLSLSPTGNSLIYSDAVPDRDIWLIDLRSGVEATRDLTRIISSTFAEDGQQYSPDGRRIAFGSSGSGHQEIWVADSDGSRPTQLTRFEVPVTGSARWPPTGMEIVIDSRPEGDSDLYVISATGGQPRRIERHPATETMASWSRDGRWTYFGSNRSGEYQIWRIPVTGGRAVQITTKGGYCAFEASDRFLYYAKNRERSDIWRIPLAGGEETRVTGPLRFQSNFHTLRDVLYYLAAPDPTSATQLRRANLSHATDPVVAVIHEDLLHGLSISPDERWALVTVNEQRAGDLIVVKNVR